MKKWYASALMTEDDDLPMIRFVESSDIITATLINSAKHVDIADEDIDEYINSDEIQDGLREVNQKLANAGDFEKMKTAAEVIYERLGVLIVTYEVPEEAIKVKYV